MLKMRECLTYLKTMMSSKKGQGMVEYGLIIGLVAVAVIVVLTTMGEEIQRLFESVAGALETAGTTGS
jgi:pilus assembly protein Flp/PilA